MAKKKTESKNNSALWNPNQLYLPKPKKKISKKKGAPK